MDNAIIAWYNQVMQVLRLSFMVAFLFLFVGGIFWYTNLNQLRSASADPAIHAGDGPLRANARLRTGTRLPIAAAIDIPLSAPVSGGGLLHPIDAFEERITKKPFGIFITPETSPVQPDRFDGFHTGVDVEYGDVPGDVPVYAIESGTVLVSRFASGYGGVTVIRHTLVDGRSLLVLYGHLDPSTLIPPGTAVVRGQSIGILGEGETDETDGVRKHLHFALIKGNATNLAVYVASAEALDGWYDPLTFYGLTQK